MKLSVQIRYILLLIILGKFSAAYSQTCIVTGKITDVNQEPIPAVFISLKEDKKVFVLTDKEGNFSFSIPDDQNQHSLTISHSTFKEKKENVQCGQRIKLSIILELKANTLTGVEISGKEEKPANMEKINIKNFQALSSASGSVESMLYSQGATSRNELSSQYSVRGGNFDENLIYVNDVEIYRPFLVRSGQQEGLSFLNANLVQDLYFSAGGFESRYGDKMSSVLDVTYKTPKDYAATIEASLLGGAVTFEGASKDYRFTQIHGFRYRTNQYLLGALETQGAYKPVFLDYQTFLKYEINDELDISFLGHISSNRYNFTPESRQTDFGTIQQAIRLSVFFEGQEKNAFDTYLGAFTFHYKPNLKNDFKWISSCFLSNEREYFDVLGQYRLSELEIDLSKESFGNEKFNLGVGSYLNHARNELLGLVLNSNFIGKHIFDRSLVQWGAKYQREHINDEYREWNLIDSAGYSLPHSPDSVGYTNPAIQSTKEIELNEFHFAQNSIFSNRYQGFVQYDKSLSGDSLKYSYTFGARFNYWDWNRQLLISPRFTLKLYPIAWNKNVNFRFATGVYQQPAFYREMRDFEGNLNKNIKAQSSAQILGGTDYFFKAWGRSFKFTTEVYYKYMWNLVPYDVENVRIRYYATNNSKGDTKGIDLRLHGQIVKGLDSWVNISLLNAREKIDNYQYYVYYNDNGQKITPAIVDQKVVDSILVKPGFMRRPTDQQVNIGMFFQDYLPGYESFKVHLNLLYGSNIPYGPLSLRLRDTLEIPPYRRVDIGFSALLKAEGSEAKQHNPFKHFKSIWATVEVFNLLAIDNTISYLWVKDTSNNNWAVPNYLTSRRINLRLVCTF